MAGRGSKSEAKKSKLAQLRSRLVRQKADLRRVNLTLTELGPGQTPGESSETTRRREALRRHRARLLFAIERTERSIQGWSGPSSRRTVVQGPKSGVTSLVQGGAPGLGRRA